MSQPKYENAEGDALVFPSGHSPIYLWCDDRAEWRKARASLNGSLLVASQDESAEASVVDPTTSAKTLFTGAGVILGVVNATASLLTIFDDTTPKMLVLPGASLLLPVSVATSAKYKIAGAAFGAQVSFSWRAT